MLNKTGHSFGRVSQGNKTKTKVTKAIQEGLRKY